jgi:four helix bundle protein
LIQRELGERLLDYGVRIIKVVEAMPGTLVGRRIGYQLLRCGTSVGANYEESRAAESTADFVHKLQVSLKELRESLYWLRLLSKANTLPSKQLEELLNESHQLRAILSKAVATAKGRAKSPLPPHI